MGRCYPCRRWPDQNERGKGGVYHRSHVPQHHHPAGLEPVATPVEIEAAARQYVRKISGVQKTSPATEAAFEAAVAEIAHITAHLLADLPPRKQPPPTLPPLRRVKVSRAVSAPGG